MMDIKQNPSSQEEIYRLLHEKSGIGIGFYKLDGTVISYNLLAAQNMGGKPEDFKGKSIYDLFPSQEAAVYHGRIKEAAASNHSLIFEDKLQLPIGEVWFLSSFTKIEDDQGTLIGIQIISQDINAQKQLEEMNLKQNIAISKLNQVSIELLKLPIEENVEALITKKIKEISGAEVVIFSEYDPVEKTTSLLHIDIKPGLLEKVVGLLGKQIKSIKTPVSDEMYSEMISQRIGTRKTLSEVSFGVISRPIGSAIQVVLNVDRFIGLAYELEGKLYGTTVLGMGKDSKDPSKEILENFISMASLSIRRKQAEEKLKESEKRLSLVIDASEQGIWDWNVLTNEVFYSEQWKKQIGYQEDELKNEFDTWIEHLHPEEKEYCQNAVLSYLKQPVEHFFLEFRFRHKDGCYRWIHNKASSLKNKEGKVIRMFGTHIDITERKQAEDEIKRLNETLEQKVQQRTKELEESNQALEAFSHSVSHDLRAPLRAINGFSQILVKEYLDHLGSEAKRLVQVVVDNTNRMDEIINGLLSISKISSLELKKRPIEMNEMVESIYQESISPSDKNRISININKLLTGFGDSTLIRQVWVNLIENAVKFSRMKEKPTIQIQSYCENDQTVYVVKDNGAGFNPEYQNKLFQMFQRLHSIEDFQGTGVGLALVHRIIQRHGGKVWAEGEEGQGATFYFSLPKDWSAQ